MSRVGSNTVYSMSLDIKIKCEYYVPYFCRPSLQSGMVVGSVKGTAQGCFASGFWFHDESGQESSQRGKPRLFMAKAGRLMD